VLRDRYAARARRRVLDEFRLAGSVHAYLELYRELGEERAVA
jgi:hypothetical protein